MSEEPKLPELDPHVLSEILGKSAAELSDEEVATLIAVFRRERVTVLAAEAAGKKKTKSPLTEAAGKAAALDLKFEDLEL